MSQAAWAVARLPELKFGTVCYQEHNIARQNGLFALTYSASSPTRIRRRHVRCCAKRTGLALLRKKMSETHPTSFKDPSGSENGASTTLQACFNHGRHRAAAHRANTLSPCDV